MRAILIAAFTFALLGLPAHAQNESDLLNLSLPDVTWAVQLRMHEWKVSFQDFKKDFRGRTLQAFDTVSGLQVSVFIDDEEKKDKFDAVGLRDYTMKNLQRISGPSYGDFKIYEDGPIAFADYVSIGDERYPQDDRRYRYAFWIRDHKWVSIRLEEEFKTAWTDSTFETFFASVKTIENYTQTAMDYFVYGSWAYNHGEFEDAARYYQAALDLEKVERTLHEYLWLVTVDNLAMSYGIPGDHKKALEILNYGLSVRPDYPMFHYNKACSFAELKKLDSALHYLARANDLRVNMIPGETLPNPVEDESFKRYKKNERLLELVKFWDKDAQ
jgi:tetratricopeptide (TPR) repeat protein